MSAPKKNRKANHELSLSFLKTLSQKRWRGLCEQFCQKLGFETKELKIVSGNDPDLILFFPNNPKPMGYVHCVNSPKYIISKSEVIALKEASDKADVPNTIIISKGRFSQEASSYASDQSIDLIDLESLFDKIYMLPGKDILELEDFAYSISIHSPLCYGCGADMEHVENNLGGFWRCQNYPKCICTYMW